MHQTEGKTVGLLDIEQSKCPQWGPSLRGDMSIDFYFRNQSQMKRFVTHRFKMDQIQEAMNSLDTSGTETMKVIMEW